MVRILLTASHFVNCLLLSPDFSGYCLHRFIVYLLPVGLGVRLFGAAFSMDRTLPIIRLCVNCLFVSPVLIQRWAGSLGHCPSVSACSVRWASILRRVLYGCTVFRMVAVRNPSAALFVMRCCRHSQGFPVPILGSGLAASCPGCSSGPGRDWLLSVPGGLLLGC